MPYLPTPENLQAPMKNQPANYHGAPGLNPGRSVIPGPLPARVVEAPARAAPVAYAPEVRAQALALRQAGQTIPQICKALNCSKTAVGRWLEGMAIPVHTLSVSITRRATLGLSLVNHLSAILQEREPDKDKRVHVGLRHGSMLDLIPPRYAGGYWLLDTTPSVGVPLVHTSNTRPKFRTAHHIGREVMKVCQAKPIDDVMQQRFYRWLESGGVGGSVPKGLSVLVCEVRSTLTLLLVDEDPARPGVFRFKAKSSPVREQLP